MSDNHPRRRRIFFALWPNDRVRQSLGRLARRLPRRRGRPVPLANLHITLAFAGSVDPDTHDCLASWAASIGTENYLLRLTRVGYFARARILWVGADECPAALTGLVHRLNEGLASCALEPAARPFRPHVTLMRDAAPLVADMEVTPVEWRVDGFCLIESQTSRDGARYTILRRFGAP